MASTRIPEKVVQQHIVALLRSLGAAVYVLGHPSPADGRAHRGTGQTPGVPDVLAFLSRKGETTSTLLFVEVKGDGGRLRPEQREFMERCYASRTVHLHGNLDAVIAWLLREQYLHASQVPHYRLPAEARA